MNNNKLTKILLIALPALAAVLTALPWCVRMVFIGGHTAYFSGFSLMLLGYGFWSPMITGVCAIALALFGLAYRATERVGLLRWMTGLAVVAVMMSITPLAFGTTTPVSALVVLLLGADAVVLFRLREDM